MAEKLKYTLHPEYSSNNYPIAYLSEITDHFPNEGILKQDYVKILEISRQFLQQSFEDNSGIIDRVISKIEGHIFTYGHLFLFLLVFQRTAECNFASIEKMTQLVDLVYKYDRQQYEFPHPLFLLGMLKYLTNVSIAVACQNWSNVINDWDNFTEEEIQLLTSIGYRFHRNEGIQPHQSGLARKRLPKYGYVDLAAFQINKFTPIYDKTQRLIVKEKKVEDQKQSVEAILDGFNDETQRPIDNKKNAEYQERLVEAILDGFNVEEIISTVIHQQDSAAVGDLIVRVSEAYGIPSPLFSIAGKPEPLVSTKGANPKIPGYKRRYNRSEPADAGSD